MFETEPEPGFDTDGGASLGGPTSNRPGMILRLAREALGIPITDVSNHTRICDRHLEALERGDYSDIKASIYAVGFARAYARYIDVPESGIVEAVRDEYGRLSKRDAR